MRLTRADTSVTPYCAWTAENERWAHQVIQLWVRREQRFLCADLQSKRKPSAWVNAVDLIPFPLFRSSLHHGDTQSAVCWAQWWHLVSRLCVLPALRTQRCLRWRNLRSRRLLPPHRALGACRSPARTFRTPEPAEGIKGGCNTQEHRPQRPTHEASNQRSALSRIFMSSSLMPLKYQIY